MSRMTRTGLTVLAAAVALAAALEAQQQQIQIVTTGPDGPVMQMGQGREFKTGTGRIRGRVVSAENGTPIRRAQVRIFGTSVAPKTAMTDGDGRYEFATRDNAFLYAFACYACSEAPLQVIAIENGAVKNVTEEPRYRPAHESCLKQMIENIPEDDINGFLAGYVGEKTLLGEGKQAWALMLEHYDRASDWGLTACSVELDEDGNCPGKEIALSFPDALEHMLKENGYKVED